MNAEKQLFLRGSQTFLPLLIRSASWICSIILYLVHLFRQYQTWYPILIYQITVSLFSPADRMLSERVSKSLSWLTITIGQSAGTHPIFCKKYSVTSLRCQKPSSAHLTSANIYCFWVSATEREEESKTQSYCYISKAFCILTVTSPVQLPIYPLVNECSEMNASLSSSKSPKCGTRLWGFDRQRLSVFLRDMQQSQQQLVNTPLRWTGTCHCVCLCWCVPTSKFKSGNFHKNVATHMGEVNLRFTFQVAYVQLWEMRG